MDNPPLSLEQLLKILLQSASYEDLFEALCPYEDDANYLFTDMEITGDRNLLSAFYSIFLISHLLVNEM
jgi:COP9 signalosome complex subunit 8